MRIRIFTLILMFFLGFILLNNTSKAQKSDSIQVIPFPKFSSLSDTNTILPEKLRVYIDTKKLRNLIPVLNYEYKMLAEGELIKVSSSTNSDLKLQLNKSLKEGQYELKIGEQIKISGASYNDIAAGSVTLMQLLLRENGKSKVPTGIIRDYSNTTYRGLLIDLARKWHDPAVLKKIILLCRWYKINYLQLHLTDNELFTFPTEKFPKLPTEGKHYTKQQLQELETFAKNRGVALIPEIDMPGHAAQFVTRMPKLFGITDWRKNELTINIGKEEVYKALDTIISEVVEIFQTTPYLHIGADEADFNNFKQDTGVQQYMKEHNIASLNELYRHFLVRMNQIVKKHGKKTIVWEGFKNKGEIEVPTDLIVMAWETLYQLPQHLIAGGYKTINVSWQPLYVTNDRKWSSEDIYRWNLYQWKNWLKEAPSYNAIQLEPNNRVIGASMASWGQSQYMELPTLTQRLPTFSERIWNATLKPQSSFKWFSNSLSFTDSTFARLISPLQIKANGMSDSSINELQKTEQFWFNDELRLSLNSNSNEVIRYTLDGTTVTNSSTKYTKPLSIKETAVFKGQAFTKKGDSVGHSIWRKYELRPLNVQINGDLVLPLSELWKTKRSWEAPFRDSVYLHVSSQKQGTIRYTANGKDPTPVSIQYSGPIKVSESTIITIQLFDSNGRKLGEQWQQNFRKID